VVEFWPLAQSVGIVLGIPAFLTFTFFFFRTLWRENDTRYEILGWEKTLKIVYLLLIAPAFLIVIISVVYNILT
jgi:hypothetical protein